jgi:hypothetical protein
MIHSHPRLGHTQPQTMRYDLLRDEATFRRRIWSKVELRKYILTLVAVLWYKGNSPRVRNKLGLAEPNRGSSPRQWAFYRRRPRRHSLRVYGHVGVDSLNSSLGQTAQGRADNPKSPAASSGGTPPIRRALAVTES